jgi:hypothetical protein
VVVAALTAPTAFAFQSSATCAGTEPVRCAVLAADDVTSATLAMQTAASIVPASFML